MNMYTIISKLPLFPVSVGREQEYKLQVQADEVSDGHHTFTELYNHRHALFHALVTVLDRDVTPLHGKGHVCWKTKFHSDGSSYPGWFLVGIDIKTLTGVKIISYHMPDEWWDKFKCKEIPLGPVYDGYTSDDVIKRLGEI